MQDGEQIPADEAGQWLRERSPELRITLSVRDEEPSPVAYRRILEILFRPRADRPTP